MKRIYFLLTVLVTAAVPAWASVADPDPNFYVFLCFGQSNMEGFPGVEQQDRNVDERFQVLAAVDFARQGRKAGKWYPAVPPLCRGATGLGPADYFGKTMVAHLPKNIRVGIVNVSVAGCKIELFDKTNYKSYAEKAPPWMQNIIKAYGGNPYAHLVEMAKLAQKDGVIKGILLHQGESNTNDKQWPAKVKGVYENLIKDLDLKPESVPLLAGELVHADQKGACASMNAIIAELPKTIPNSYVISSAGCESWPDHLHFTAAGYRELGKRYGEKMLSLLGQKIDEPRDAKKPPAPDQAFLRDHCTRCHNGEDKKGRLDLTQLAFTANDSNNLAVWIKVHDRVKAGEMPPATRPRPDTSRQQAFVTDLADGIASAERGALAGEGRAMQRRLNRQEYENALRDLLGVPWAPLANRLPEDGEAYRFNKSGEALDVSYVQIARFMDSADYAMRLAMATRLDRPAKTTRKLYARDEFSLRNWWPRENGTLPDRLSFPVLDGHAQPDVRAGRAPASSPATREREAVGKVSSIFSDAGGYSWNGWRASVAARYKLRIAGYTIWVAGGGVARWFYEGQGNQKAPVYHTLLWHRPNLDEVYPGKRNEPIGVYASGGGQTRPIGAIDFTPQPSIREIEVFLLPGEVVRTDGSRLFRTRVNGTDEQYVNPLATEDGMPGYAIQWLEIEGPFFDDPVGGAGYRLLFDQLPLKPSTQPRQGVPLEIGPSPAAGPGLGGGRGGRGGPGGPGAFGRGGIRTALYEVASTAPRQDAERLVRSFMKKVYREPIVDADVQRFLALYDQHFERGSGFTRAMLTTYTAILASPGFVFIQPKPGQLDDHALATRLALFLWNSVPDEALRVLADRGELTKPGVLRLQTERLLDDPKAQRFVEAFTDYWLDLRKMDDTAPSTTLYNDYELDDPLKLATVEETRLFFTELLRADLPARNIVDSDFTFLNERLADHYGISGVWGSGFRKVKLPPDSLRGGLLTQASVLKVTANGTTTSPVLRGHWITERILGLETPPPPPTVEPVEPDIRGAVTIRQQLEKHRNNPSCAACHSKMDPPGFALESFDVMGGFRERYRAVSDNTPPVKGFGMNGQAFAFHYALPVDSAGALPDGRPFKDVRELKKLLAQDEAALARNLVRQLTIFATGAPVRFSDREAIDNVLATAKANHYGVRSMIHALVQSELFRNK